MFGWQPWLIFEHAVPGSCQPWRGEVCARREALRLCRLVPYKRHSDPQRLAREVCMSKQRHLRVERAPAKSQCGSTGLLLARRCKGLAFLLESIACITGLATYGTPLCEPSSSVHTSSAGHSCLGTPCTAQRCCQALAGMLLTQQPPAWLLSGVGPPCTKVAQRWHSR